MTIGAVVVVIPARDESALIGRCLRSVSSAIDHLQSADGAPSVRVVVVLDRCSDDTAELVSSFTFVEAVEIDAGSVGVARSAGIDHALARERVAPTRIWIANTDADSVVPSEWLVEQVRLADAGADVVIGSVSPVMTDLAENLAEAWKKLRSRRSPAGNVHGANLGFRASSYRLAGGFGSEPLHEDVGLVARFSGISATLCSSLDIDVETSGRKANRVPGGYGSYLHDGSLLHRAQAAIPSEF
ncbi:glycosyltransferase family 2 protein [Lacisediminihabitans sp. FW035]